MTRFASFFLLSAWISLTNAACTNYVPASGFLSGAPNDQRYTASAIKSHVVSPVVDCSGNALGTDANDNLRCNSTQCGLTVPPYYLVNIESELNITVPEEQYRDILALVKRNTSQLAGNALFDFNSTMTVNVAGATCMPEGSVQWWSFTPVLECSEGTLEGCSGSDGPSNGTPIRACGARYFAIGNNGLGIPYQGPNIVTGAGIVAQPVPANATIIDNSRYVNGASSLLANRWTYLAVFTICIFEIL